MSASGPSATARHGVPPKASPPTAHGGGLARDELPVAQEYRLDLRDDRSREPEVQVDDAFVLAGRRRDSCSRMLSPPVKRDRPVDGEDLAVIA